MMSSLTFANQLGALAVAPSNNKYILASTTNPNEAIGRELRKTSNAGETATWVDISAGLPLDKADISSVTFHAENPDIIWVTFSGFSIKNKVFKSSNGGSSWTNISGTLPNIPINAMVYQKNSSNTIYIGTDLGVFYINDDVTDWQAFNEGAPNMIVTDLEIFYPSNKLRASTWGRGIWESLLASTNSINEQPLKNLTSVYPNPSTGIVEINLPDLNKEQVSIEVYDVLGNYLRPYSSTNGEGRFLLDLSGEPKGIYLLSVKVGEKRIMRKLCLQ